MVGSSRLHLPNSQDQPERGWVVISPVNLETKPSNTCTHTEGFSTGHTLVFYIHNK